MSNTNGFWKLNIISPSLNQNFYQKLVNWFTKFIPITFVQNLLNEEYLDLNFEEQVNHKHFEESETEIETCEFLEELKYPQEYDSYFPFVIVLDDINKKEKNDHRIQALFKQSAHNNKTLFIIKQNIKNYQKELLELIGLSLIHPNQSISEMFKISIQTKHLWIRHSLILDY